MGGAQSAIRFYQYGRKNFTQTGWKKHQKEYSLDPVKNLNLDTVDLNGKVFAVTGANSGIGKCLTEFLAKQGAQVYMICRNESRAEKAKQEIAESINLKDEKKLSVIVADMSLSSGVKKAVAEMEKANIALDGLVCNAGALLSKKEITSEGVEVTFAAHLAYGTYLLTQMSLPLLKKSSNPRVIVVSSGGMYSTAYPGWDASAKADVKSFNGQLAYAYAKRGQVLLVNKWADILSDEIKIVSCHPGWTTTPGVDKAYGSAQWFLRPLRSVWEGTEGIAWLCSTPPETLKSGAFYLDREPQPTTLSKSTETSEGKLNELIQGLENLTGVPLQS